MDHTIPLFFNTFISIEFHVYFHTDNEFPMNFFQLTFVDALAGTVEIPVFPFGILALTPTTRDGTVSQLHDTEPNISKRTPPPPPLIQAEQHTDEPLRSLQTYSYRMTLR
jgi:hypothetical protein